MRSTPTFFRLCLLLLCCTSFTLQAQDVRKLISVQGTLKDRDGVTISGDDLEFTFSLYHQEEDGTALWTETVTLDVPGGIYSHNLGSVNELQDAIFAQTAYLGITVGQGSDELEPRTTLTYAPYALSVNSAQSVAAGGCSGQVGDVKYSILAPDQFRQENGDCWVAMNGGAIAPGNKLRDTYGFNNVPDGSGVFLRAQNWPGGVIRDVDRGENTAVATYQSDQNRTHSHTIDPSGKHHHDYSDSYLAYVLSDSSNDNNTGVHSVSHSGTWTFVANDYDLDTDRLGFLNSLAAGDTAEEPDHTHTMQNSGGGESRPENLNFYLYIRIN